MIIYRNKVCREAIDTERLTPLIMCAFIFLFAFIISRILLSFHTSSVKKHVFSFGRPSEESASALFLSEFGERNVIINASFIYTDENGVSKRTVPGDIIVLRSCIVCVRYVTLIGKIDTESERLWHQSVRTTSTGRKELDFPSPVFENEMRVKAIEQILKRECKEVPPLYNAVIFTSEKVVFTLERPEVLCLRAALRKIKKLSRRQGCSFKKKLTYIAAIRKFSSGQRASGFNTDIRIQK